MRYHTLPSVGTKDQRFKNAYVPFIRDLESFQINVYDDLSTHHIATIGDGVNLRLGGNMAAVLNELGVFTASDNQVATARNLAGKSPETDDIRLARHDTMVATFMNIVASHDLSRKVSDGAGNSASEIALQIALRNELHIYLPTTDFALNRDQSKNIIGTLLDGYSVGVSYHDPGKIDALDRRLAAHNITVDHASKEYVALMSLFYNSPQLLGPGLLDALHDGNRAEAWFEIRYQSNGGDAQGGGIAKRRYVEAATFGLFNEKPNTEDYKNAYRMLTRHRDDLIYGQRGMLGYDTHYANNLRDAYTISHDVASLEASFAPAYHDLIHNYVNIDGVTDGIVINWLDIQIAGNAGSTLSGTRRNDANVIGVGAERNDLMIGSEVSDTLSGGGGRDVIYGEGGEDILHGGNGADVLLGGQDKDKLHGGAGDDYLYGGDNDSSVDDNASDMLFGENGNDHLFGGKGSDLLDGGEGDDVLNGGEGNDVYVFRGNHGNDMVDDSGANSLIVEDTLAAYGVYDGAGHYTQSGSNLIFNKDSSLTLSDNTGGTIKLKNWHNGDFGIRLFDAPERTTHDDLTVENPGAEGVKTKNSRLIMWGGDGNDKISGTSGDDFIVGRNLFTFSHEHNDAKGYDVYDRETPVTSRDNDIIHGKGGDDRIFGNEGNDLLYGDAGIDKLRGGIGDDYLDGGVGDDELSGEEGNDVLYGGKGNDKLAGDATNVPGSIINGVVYKYGNDILDGGEGNDTLLGSYGNDVLIGGAGNDILYGGSDTNALTDMYGNLFNGNDTLFGGSGNDTLYGGYGDDQLFGGSGNDKLYGGAGHDVLMGGAGDDTYEFDLGDQRLSINDTEGFNTLRFGAGITPATLKLGLGSLKITVGNNGDEIHIENFNPNNPSQRIGIDQFEFADGTVLSYSQLLARGFVTDGTNGDDTIQGTVLSERINGLAGNDVIIAKQGNDHVNGGAGNDTLYGNEGNDTLDGQAGIDTLIGGVGDDTYKVDSTTDVLTEYAGEGTDTVESTVGYTLTDNFENLTLKGMAVHGTGNTQNNVIKGNDRANILDGGAGADLLIGGAGDDAYYVDNTGDLVTEAADTVTKTAVDLGNGTIGYDTVIQSGGSDSVFSSVSYAMRDFTENLTLTGTDNLDGNGNLFAQRITGNAGNNTLYAYRLNTAIDQQKQSPVGFSNIIPKSGMDERLYDRAEHAIFYADYQQETNGSHFNFDLSSQQGVTLAGGAGNDRLFGDLDNDTLIGGAGDDLLYGFGGSDQLIGGQGNDTYVIGGGYSESLGGRNFTITFHGDGTDTVIEKANGGVDTVMSEVDYTLGANLENLQLLDSTGQFDQAARYPQAYDNLPRSTNHSLTGTGNELDNTLTANNYGNHLLGLGGNDLLTGGIGTDTLDGGVGADVMRGGYGDDRYFVDNIHDVVAEDAISGGIDEVDTALDYTLGANLENLTLTGVENRTGTGNALNNILQGNQGNNVLSGLAGNDDLSGNAGNDVLDGGAGNDILDGGAGADIMTGGSGDDRYLVDNLADVTTEGVAQGNDTVASTITHTLGANIENLDLTGSNAIDGTGNELNNVIHGNDANNVIDAAGGDDIVQANGGDDTLYGGAGNDILYGNSGNDSIDGGTGNDMIDGGDGADQMHGGTGDDHFIVNQFGDSVSELANEGTDSVQSSVSFTLSANVENLQLTGAVGTRGTGNALDNVITGNDEGNNINGLAGNDTIDGKAGDDLLYGGEGDDHVYGGDDVIEYTGGNGGNGACTPEMMMMELCVPGNPSPSTAYSVGANRDYLDGGAGNDTLDGGSGDDTLYGGDGNDSLYGGDDGAAFYADPMSNGGGGLSEEGPPPGYGSGNGDVVLINASNNDYLDGGAGIDHLDGGSGDDILLGGSGADTLIGGTGNDNLDGGSGIDTLRGGQGNDVYTVDGYTKTTIIPSAPVPAPGAGNGNSSSDSSCSLDDHDGTHDEHDAPEHHAKGNEGVGNGEDAPPPGHEHNQNDGEGTLPGDPAHKRKHTDRSARARHEDQDHGDDDHHDDDHQEQRHEHAHHDDGEAPHCDCTLPADAFIPAGSNTVPGNGDTVIVTTVTDSVIEQANEGYDIVNSTINYTLTQNVEQLNLVGPGALQGTGNSLDNLINGNAYNNILDGAAGADQLVGAAGDDTYVVDNLGDVLVEQAGEGNDTLQTTLDNLSLQSYDNIENIQAIGDGDLRLSGNGGNNTLIGNQGNNTLSGLGGDDVLQGGAGNDTLRGGAGNDTYIYRIGDGVDVIDDRLGNNSVTFGDGITAHNVVARTTTASNGITTVQVRLLDVYGNELQDHGFDYTLNADQSSPIGQFNFADGAQATLADLRIQTVETTGSRRSDTIITDRNDDIIHAGRGHDSVHAGGGNDIVHGEQGRDQLNGGAGNDRLFGGRGNDRLNGGFGTDLLYGDAGNDRLYGSYNNDLLQGGRGGDSLRGGQGNDALIGGKGNDEYHIACGEDILLYNKGDGKDGISTSKDVDKLTVSLGGGIALADLSLQRDGEDLVLEIGDQAHHGEAGREEECRQDDHHKAHKDASHDDHPDQHEDEHKGKLVFEGWYGEEEQPGVQPHVTLQVLISASSEFNAGSSNPLLNKRVQQFDFNALVHQYEAISSGEHNADAWQVLDGMLDAHLGGSDDSALGGDIAYRYGLDGSNASLAPDKLISTLSDPRFGKQEQHLVAG